MRSLVLGLLAVLVLGMVACTPQEPDVTEEAEDDGGEGGGGETFTFVAVDIDWDDVPEELPAGAVTLELVNDGNTIHNLTVEELGDEVVAEADGGQTDSGTAELEPGEYTFYCSVPGHREAGMETTVTVAE